MTRLLAYTLTAAITAAAALYAAIVLPWANNNEWETWT